MHAVNLFYNTIYEEMGIRQLIFPFVHCEAIDPSGTFIVIMKIPEGSRSLSGMRSRNDHLVPQILHGKCFRQRFPKNRA
jgi:hypothetical protein